MGLLSLVGLGAGATKEIISRPATTQQPESTKQPIGAPGINLQAEVDRINAENEQLRSINMSEKTKKILQNLDKAVSLNKPTKNIESGMYLEQNRLNAIKKDYESTGFSVTKKNFKNYWEGLTGEKLTNEESSEYIKKIFGQSVRQPESTKQPIEAPGINLQPEVDRINAENEKIRQIAAQQPEKGTPLNIQQAPLKSTEQPAIPVQPAKPVPATEAQGIKPTPEIETLPNTPKFKEKQLIPKEEDNAKEIRGNERPVQEGGVVPKGGEDKGGENIQQPEKIRGTEVEQQAQKEVSVSRETESIADMSTIGYSDRTSYRQDLEESTKNAEQNKTKVSHAAIDMQNMGAINESFNHETANEILVNLATTFKNSIESNKPENSTIKFYRPGKGDEFAVIANGLNKDELGVLVKKGQDEVTKVINSKKYTSKTGKDINLTELVHPKHDNLETGAGYFSVGVSDFEETKDIKKMVNLADSRATEDAKDNISGIAKKSIDKRGVFVYNTNTGRWSREDSVIGKIIGEKTRSGEWKETDYNILRQKAKDEISKGGEYEYHGQTGETARGIKGSEENAGQIRKQPVEGKEEKGTRAEKEVVTEKQAAVDLVESKTKKELNEKLDSIFGNIPEERLAELDDGAKFKNNDEETNYELSTKYRADLEHAATQRDYNETEKIYKEIKIHKELVKRETLPSAGRENINAETGTPRKVRVKKEPSKTPMASAIAEAEKKMDDFPGWHDTAIIKNEKANKTISKIAQKYNVDKTELEYLVIKEKEKKLNKKPAQPAEAKKPEEKPEEKKEPYYSKQLSEATKENPITFENAKDIAKARIPQELWDKCIIRLHKTPGESQGAIYVANGVLIVDINPDTPPSRLVRVLFHDIMGHAGAANVLKTNNKIHKRLNALYNTSTAKIQKKSILNSYKDKFDKRRAEGATEQEIENELFAEWIAHNVEKYLATKDKQGLAYQVWKAIKEFLIEMGWKEDTIDEAIGSLVKEIRKTKDFKATISITPEMKESVISEGQPMFAKELQLDSSGIPIESTMDKIRQKVQDRFLRLEKLQKALNPDIREEMDARLAQRLYSGRAEARLDEFENKHFKPLREKIVASKIKVNELEDYLYAKHAAERNEHIRNIRPKETEEFLTEQEMDLLNKANEIGYNKANESDPDKIEKYDKQLENIILELKNINITKEKIIYTIAGSGMFNTTADKEAAIKTYSALDNEVLLEEIKEMPVAEEIINKFKDEGKINKLESLASDVYDITDRVRNVLLEGGLIDEETKKAWESYEFYVPLQGIKDEDKTPRVGRGFDIRGKESKRSLGRRSKAQKILSTIIVQTNEAIIRAEKNRVAKAFLNFVKANPNENLWVVDEAKKTAFFNENTGEVEYRIDPKYRLAKNIMSVKVDGKEYHITIKDNTKKENNTLARSMVNLGADNVNVVLQGFAKINRYFAQINTGFNPEFVLRNPIKDIQTAMIKLTVDHDIKTAFDVAKKIPFAIKWVLEGEADKTSEGARWYKEYKQSGGKIGYLGLSSVDDVEKTLKTEIKLMEGGTKEEIIKTGKNILKFVYAANNAVENAARLSTYIIMRQKGISKSESAKEARSVTVDFNMQGEWSKFFKPLYLFSGSSIQGSAMVLKLMKKRKMQYIAGGIVAGSIAIAEFGRLIGGKDDDDEYFYDKLPAFTRDNNLVLMGVGGKIHAKIPLPYGFSTFYAFGQAVDRVVHKNKKEDILQTTADFTTAILNSFNPLGSTANLMQTITPTSFRWITDIKLNKNFFGGDVYKKPDKYGTPKAQSSTYFKGSSIPARKIAKGLNVVTGGGEYEKGIVDLPPDALDYVFEYFTGGLGKMANRLISLPIKLSTGKKITLNEIPFVRSFVGEVSEYQDINTFYENVNNVETKRKEYESLQMDNKEKAERYYNKNKDILLLTAKIPIGENERETTIVNKMEQEIKDLRKIKDAAEKQNKLDLVKKYEDKILALIKKYNLKFNKAGK
jgi:GGDEF domain-containing protein